MRKAFGWIVPAAVMVAVVLGAPLLASSEPAVPERKPPKMVPDQWHSRGSIDSFAAGGMSKEDCERYGLRYGYSECNRYKQRQPVAAERRLEAASAEEESGTEQTVLTPEEARPDRLATLETPPATRSVAEPAADRASQINEMILVTFNGVAASDEDVGRVMRLLSEGHIGGVVLRPANIRSDAQVAELTRMFHAAQQDVRPLIAFRLPTPNGKTDRPAYPAPGLAAYGGDPEAAFRVHARIARKLARLGLDLSVAPRLVPERIDASPTQAVENIAAFATVFILAHREAALRVAPDAAARPVLRALAGKGYLDAIYRSSSRRNGDAGGTAPSRDSFNGLAITAIPRNVASDPSRLRRVVLDSAKAGSDLFVLPSTDNAIVQATRDVFMKGLRDGDLTRGALQASSDDIQALKRALPLHIVETRQ